jgi:flagellar basal body rod protein FlgG
MLLRLQNSVAAMTTMVREQERTANNLANANTVGFRRERTFLEVLREQPDAERAPRSERTQGQWSDALPGPFEQTHRPLDAALGGTGFFVLTDEATGQSRYTRAGHFTLDAEGTLRTPQGFAVDGDGGPLVLPPNASQIEINGLGEVRADGQLAGTLRVVTFARPEQLPRLDGATFAAGNQTPEPLDQPDVRQGFLENSNVNTVEEMTDLIEHYRLFETSQKTLRTTDDLLGLVTRDLGRF